MDISTISSPDIELSEEIRHEYINFPNVDEVEEIANDFFGYCGLPGTYIPIYKHTVYNKSWLRSNKLCL